MLDTLRHALTQEQGSEASSYSTMEVACASAAATAVTDNRPHAANIVCCQANSERSRSSPVFTHIRVSMPRNMTVAKTSATTSSAGMVEVGYRWRAPTLVVLVLRTQEVQFNTVVSSQTALFVCALALLFALCNSGGAITANDLIGCTYRLASTGLSQRTTSTFSTVLAEGGSAFQLRCSAHSGLARLLLWTSGAELSSLDCQSTVNISA